MKREGDEDRRIVEGVGEDKEGGGEEMRMICQFERRE